MKKFKKAVISIILAAAMLAAFVPAAFASPCCTIDKVGEIFEDESGLKVKYVCDFKDSGKTERRVRMALIGEYTKNDYGNMVGRFINRQYQVVEQDQEYTYEVDKSMLIKGHTYEIDIDYADYCSWGACYSEFPVKYTCGYGMPEFEFNGPGKDTLTLIGNDIAAVSFTADAAGYYNIGVESEYDNIDIKEYGYDNVVPGKYTYFKENETKTYVFKPREEETLNAVVSFTRAEAVPQTALKEPPLSDGDVCYRMNGSGLMSFEISQRGVYRFNVDGEAEYTVENANHETVYDESYWEPDIILEAGKYYIYNDSDEEGTVTITYTEPETVEFGKQYSYPVSENEQFERYFTINISQPALLTLDDSSNVSIFALRRNDEENDIEINKRKPSRMLNAGKYFVKIYGTQGTDAEFKLTAVFPESIALDTETVSDMPAYIYSQQRYYLVFKAPSDGKYEFDLTKSKGRVNNTNIDKGYVTLEMKSGEWALIYTEEQTAVTVREYRMPEDIPLEFDEEASFEYVSGKTYLYSFTPSEDGFYKIYSEKFYFNHISIYTDTEQLYDKDVDRILSARLNLKKDEKIYIKFFGVTDYRINDYTQYLRVTNAVEQLNDGDNTVTLADEAYTEYTAPEDGYYQTVMRLSGGDSVAAEINGNIKYIGRYDDTVKVLYLKKGEKLNIKFSADDSSYRCGISVKISAINTEKISLNETISAKGNSYYSFVAEKDGAYSVSGEDMIEITQAGNICKALSTSDGAAYLIAEAGKEYLICPFKDTEMTVTEMGIDDITVGNTYKTGQSVQMLKFEIPEDGLYRVKNNICNMNVEITAKPLDETEVFSANPEENSIALFGTEAVSVREDKTVTGSGGGSTSGGGGGSSSGSSGGGGSMGGTIHRTKKLWTRIKGTEYELFELNAGTCYIISIPQASKTGMDEPYAELTVTKAESNAKLGITLDDYFYSSIDGAELNFTVTAPYKKRWQIGLEITDGKGKASEEVIGYVNTYNADLLHKAYRWDDAEKAQTYTVRPYICNSNNEKEKVYGKKQKITMTARDRFIPIKYNTKTIHVSPDVNGDSTGYYFEFTQPQDAEGKTYVKAKFSFVSLYDENFKYMDYPYYGGYTLEPGKKYYVGFYAHNTGTEEISVSSLPAAPESVPYEVKDAKFTESGVSFTASGSSDTEAMVCGALYDDDGRMIELVINKDIPNSGTMDFNRIKDGKTCKLIIADSFSAAPLCENAEITK